MSTNAFPGPFRNPNGPFNVVATFDAGWDGGDVVIIGTDPNGADQTETLTPPSDVATQTMTVVGLKFFQAIEAAVKVIIPNNPFLAGSNGATVELGARGVYERLVLRGLSMGGFGPNPLEILMPVAKEVEVEFCSITRADDTLSFQASSDGSTVNLIRLPHRPAHVGNRNSLRFR